MPYCCVLPLCDCIALFEEAMRVFLNHWPYLSFHYPLSWSETAALETRGGLVCQAVIVLRLPPLWSRPWWERLDLGLGLKATVGAPAQSRWAPALWCILVFVKIDMIWYLRSFCNVG